MTGKHTSYSYPVGLVLAALETKTLIVRTFT